MPVKTETYNLYLSKSQVFRSLKTKIKNCNKRISFDITIFRTSQLHFLAEIFLK